MTKVEQAELLELGLTEAQVEQRAQEISTKLHEPRAEYINMVEVKGTPTRKRRSDAGKPKARKAEAVPGVLTSIQVQMIRDLMGKRDYCLRNLGEAQDSFTNAQFALDCFLNDLAKSDAQ